MMPNSRRTEKNVWQALSAAAELKGMLVVPILALAACGAPAVQAVPDGGVPVSVTSATGVPYTYADGAQAKKQADAQCGTGGVRPTIYDRFDEGTGAWVFPGGCA